MIVKAAVWIGAYITLLGMWLLLAPGLMTAIIFLSGMLAGVTLVLMSDRKPRTAGTAPLPPVRKNSYRGYFGDLGE